MSTISEKTNELFMASSLSDDDLGYPSEVSFVPGDRSDRKGWLTKASCIFVRCMEDSGHG